jgi:hypothetical protein
MRWFQLSFASLVVASLMSVTLAHATSFTGTVTNKTNGKPSAGDTVVLVDVQAGMSEAASATTDSAGKYTLESPGMGPYLVRVNHQGGTYFIAAPQGGGSGDITVYDVAAKVEGVGIDADMLLLEAGGGMLRVHERYLVRNASLPPKAQFSGNTFEVVIPADAELDGASATRPGGLATNTHLLPLGQKGHYSFNVPIQPDQGEKETLFEVQYHLPYNGKYAFAPELQMSADNLVIYAAKGMDFTAARGSSFQSVQQDPKVQTFIAKSVHPGQVIGFTIAGEGQMSHEAQGPGMGEAQMAGAGNPGNGPGGGLGVPIGTPDPLTTYKWWILAGLALLLIGGAVFLLRRRSEFATAMPVHADTEVYETYRPPTATPAPVSPSAQPRGITGGSAIWLSMLKDELFAIESEKLSGTLSQSEYAEIKLGLDAVLKRVLNKK